MVFYSLKCALGHDFEGWFASEESFSAQRARGYVTCPYCQSHQISATPQAPEPQVTACDPLEESGQQAGSQEPAAPLDEILSHLTSPFSAQTSPAVLVATIQALTIFQLKLIQSVLTNMNASLSEEEKSMVARSPTIVVFENASPVSAEEGEVTGPDESITGTVH
ncbi:DUF1178 family protein [Ferrovum myxofaciens]|jgi:hypothetical protein|uniref:DUF1178 family protein n=1 Tax=Ferrovum myxofaciens TaxID=416213 RepID=UPI0004E0CD1A|nr:DUF1178 family protein [Ferrovum myxofaciens]